MKAQSMGYSFCSFLYSLIFFIFFCLNFNEISNQQNEKKNRIKALLHSDAGISFNNFDLFFNVIS